MIEFINKFKIPTILGIGIIFFGIFSGVFLVLREQTFLSQAAPALTPTDITLTNITEDSAVISWQTNSAASSFITFGQNNPGEQTVLDDRDSGPPAGGPTPRLTHYVTLKNLLSKTNYQFKIISSKITSDVKKFETASPVTNQTGFTPVIGSVLDGDTPLRDGIVYLSIPEAVTQSSLIKGGGNFLIPLSQIRKSDLSDTYPLIEEMTAKLTVRSDKGESNVLFKLTANSVPLPSIRLGQNTDLTILEEIEYDLNADTKINAADNAIILQNFGNPAGGSKKGDLNGDGAVNQKDLDLMAKKLEERMFQ